MAKAENPREAVGELKEWHRDNYHFIDSTLTELRQILRHISSSEARAELDKADSHFAQGIRALEEFFKLTDDKPGA